ncbi:MAG: SAM-dependent methyltransferase [Phycisphaerales bacterium JB040]
MAPSAPTTRPLPASRSSRDLGRGCFRIGTCHDLIDGLERAHARGVPMPQRHWGLKLLGYAWVADVLHDTQRFGRVLEAGVGFGDEMYRAFGGNGHERAPGREVWTIDNSAFYTPERVAEGRARRAHCTDVDGLLGEHRAGLPDEGFDAVFSISALEHAPLETVPDVCADLWRVTRPGGVGVHTLDFALDEVGRTMGPWLEGLRAAGFEIDDEGVDLAVGLCNTDGEAYLFEPAESVVRNWCKRRIGDGKAPVRFTTRHAAVLVVARKPEERH